MGRGSECECSAYCDPSRCHREPPLRFRNNLGRLYIFAPFTTVIPCFGGPMVLTKEELIGSLQNEVRILLHLAGKIDRSKLDYRPTDKQRSTIELLRYLVVMG